MWEWAINYEPQATAVELAQLGEGDSPKSSVSHETKQELFLGKTVGNIRQKGVPPLLLPASVLQLPRCLVRICNLFLINHKIANLTVSKMQLQQGKRIAE